MSIPLRKRVRRALRARLLRVLAVVASLLPVGLALACGRALGRIAHRIATRPRKLAQAHLALAFPELPEAKRAAIGREVFVRLGENLFENLVIHKIERRLPAWVEIDPESLEHFERAYATGRGVIVATGHLGNWELAARAMVRRGFPVAALARRSHDASLGAMMERFRREGGVEPIYRGEEGAVRKILRQLRSGSSLFLLVDQDLDAASVFVPFFHTTARSVRGPAELALKRGATLLVATITRTAPGGPHRIEATPIDAKPGGDHEADVLRVTAAIQRALEAAIRRAPGQWVWFHRRWYRRPLKHSAGA